MRLTRLGSARGSLLLAGGPLFYFAYFYVVESFYALFLGQLDCGSIV